MNKKILIGSIIAVILLIIISFPTVIGGPEEIGNDKIKIYTNAKIKTPKMCEGQVYCFPGYIHSLERSKKILFQPLVIYKYYVGFSSWYFTIDGSRVGEGNGYIFGFSGVVRNWREGFAGFFLKDFKIDGIGCLIIHILN